MATSMPANGEAAAEGRPATGDAPARAYFLALRVTGRPDLAEEAAQDAWVRLLGGSAALSGGPDFAVRLLRLTREAAIDLLRSETARARREGALAMNAVAPRTDSGRPDSRLELRELGAAARAALGRLPMETRLAVSLCCEQGLTQAQAGEVLGLPQREVARAVQGGLDRLRKELEAAGFAATAGASLAASLASLGLPAPPAAFAARLAALASARPAAAGAGATGAALKGGLIVKIGLGIAAAGLVAGTALWAVGGSSGETAKPAEKPAKFATPVSDPSARWVHEDFVRIKNCGDPLDGPREGMGTNATPGTGIYLEGGGDSYFRKYDPELDRYFTYSGGAIGCLDGPVSRARVNTEGYAHERSGASSPDGRYRYFTEPDLNGMLRCLDTQKGEIKTILKEVGGSPGMCADSKGNLYIVSYSGFQVVTPDGKVEKRPLEFAKGTQGYALCVVIDEVSNRLYGARRDAHIWYWDLAAGGKYVEIMNAETSKAPARALCATGPFDGTRLHCPAGLNKFPVPEVKFLYFGGGDDTSFYQLDLEKKYLLRFRPLDAEKGFFGMAEANGKVGKAIEGWCGPPRWFGKDGDFLLGDWASGGSALYRYKRVK